MSSILEYFPARVIANLYLFFMGKIINAIIFAALIAATFLVFKKTENMDAPKEAIVKLDEYGDPIPDDTNNQVNAEGTKFFTRFGMAILCTVYGGILFAVYALPAIAHKATHVAYDSGEKVGPDPLHDARAAVAQGDYKKAVEKFYEGAKADPFNRMPYIEIAKIQRDHFGDVDAAINTLRQGLESQEWRENDAATFMFRIAELYQNDKQDTFNAAEILRQVISLFPESRHSANATHKLREMGLA